MSIFWICENCGTENEYPQVKVCVCCGEKITPQTEEPVLVVYKREQERLEEKRRIEKERRIREEFEKRLELMEKKDRDFASAICICSNYSIIVLRILVLLSILVAAFLFKENYKEVNINNMLNSVSDNIYVEYLAHTVDVSDYEVELKDMKIVEKRSSRILIRLSSSFSALGRNLLSSIEEHYANLKNSLLYSFSNIRVFGNGLKEKWNHMLEKLTGGWKNLLLSFHDVWLKIRERANILQRRFRPVEKYNYVVRKINEYISGGVVYENV